ncbi:MAG: hypothetical protein LBI03_03145 [Clostridiales bacterium]|jgi:hypothetical protein|nr:hypothetical protein [Clostridiales bacterium]
MINTTPFETMEIPKNKITDSPLAKALEGKVFDKPMSEYDKPLVKLADTGSFEITDIDYGVVFEGLDKYDFDGIDFNQDPERLSALLDGFTEENWNNMDMDGRKEQILKLSDYVKDVLALENPPNIDYYYEPWGTYGDYDPIENTVHINEYMLDDPYEAADTVAHELWHTYQHERALSPESPKDFQYEIGFDNYICPWDDFDGYQTQLVEAEARAFADQFKGSIA